MARTIIKKHASTIMKILNMKAEAIRDIEHRGIKGKLRELFVSEVLDSFLTSQFGIGTGTIINTDGVQSNEMDIIIYDKRILPPFIQEQDLAVYPIESVIATIEVKSKLDRCALLDTEKSAEILRTKVFNPRASLFARNSQSNTFYKTAPICSIFGFYGRGAKDLASQTSGKTWLKKNIKHLQAICLANKYSWLNVGGKGWSLCMVDRETNEEMKRFISVTLDNVRTSAELRFRIVSDERHKDWLSAYIRK